MRLPTFQRSENEEVVTKVEHVPFEIALDLTGFGKNNYFILFTCSTSILGAIMELFGMSFIVQAGACDLNLTLDQRGLLSGLPMVGVIITAYFWGYITDTKGRRVALLMSMSIGFLFSFLSSFSPNMWTMATLKILSVTFSAGAYATAYTLLGEYQPQKYRDKILVLLTCSNVIAESVMVAIAYPILTYLDFQYHIPILGIMYRPWRLMIVFFSLPMAVSAICFFFVDESPKYLISKHQEKEALDVLKKIYAWNTGNNIDKYPVFSLSFSEHRSNNQDVPFLKSMWDQFVPLVQKPYRKFTMIIFFITFSVCFVANAFGMWLPYIFNKFSLGLSDEKVHSENFCTIFNNNVTSNIPENKEKCDDTINDITFIAIFSFSVGAFLMTACIAFLVNFVGKNWLIVGLFAFTGFCGFILNWIRIPALSLVLFTLFAFVFIGMGILPAFVVDIYPTYVRGMAGCLSTMSGRFGSFIGTYLTGVIFEPYCEEIFYTYSCLIFLTAIAAFMLPTNKNTYSKKSGNS